MLARDERDSTVGAAAVAALRDLHIGVVGWGRNATIAPEWVVVVRLPEVGEEVLPVELAIVAIDLGDLFLELVHEALREAAHDIDLPDAPLLLGLDHTEDHVDRLLLGITDEAAGIEDNDLSVDCGRIVLDLVTVCQELADKLLRVH